jgi:iron complex outermembrane receptor protein
MRTNDQGTSAVRKNLRSIVLCSSMIGGFLALGAPALAQTQSGDAPATVEEIIVTGSRLPRTDLTAPSPTTVVGERRDQAVGQRHA